MEKEYKQSFFYHRIPESSEIQQKTGLIAKPAWLFGIIDSSGSMSSHWKFVADNYNQLMDEVDQDKVITLCFDDTIRNEPKKKISDQIYKYGSGSTDILLAFQEFEKRIKLIPVDDEIKVIFLSDGQDTCNQNLQEKLKTLKGGQNRKITFMCLGVQAGFPTFISMFLRELYHRGDATCPSIFLVEYSSDKAFFNKFQSIRPFIKVKEDIKVEPEQFLFPWEAVSGTIPEGRWIMSEDKEIKLNGGTGKVTYDDKNFSVDAVIDIFRSWTQKLQLDSINKKITAEKTKEYAESTYNLMMDIIEDIRKSKGLRLIVTDQDEKTANDSFNSKVLNLQIKRTGSRIQGFVTSMFDLKKGQNLQQLSEFEAAKIIGLGTIVGKHQQRALAMKNITKEKFKQMVQDFAKTLSVTPLENKTDIEPAFGTKITPYKLFTDSTLKDGLDIIDSPLIFLELFPIQGIPVKIKRNEGCETDPWKIEIKEYSTVHKSVDASTFDLAMHKVNLPENNVEVEYQGFVPLFGEKDQQLAPLLVTELVKYAISYAAVFEIDEVLDQAYLSLLTGLFEVAYKKNDEYANEIIDKIYWSLCIIEREPYFEKIVNGFKNGDGEVLASIQSTGLFYLVVYYLSRKIKDQEECEEFVQKLWIAYFSKKFETKKIGDFVSTEQESNIKEELKKKYTTEYILKTFYTGNHIKTHLKTNLAHEIKSNDQIGQNAKILLNKTIYTADINDTINFDTTKRLSKDSAGVELKEDDIINYLAHCILHPQAKDRFSALMSADTQSSYSAIAKEFIVKDDTSKQLVKRINYQLLDELAVVYYKEFKKHHWNILPQKKEELEKECAAKQIDFNSLGFNAESGLCKNACMSKSCPWYLFVRKKDRSLRSHLGGWQGFMPRGFHAYVRGHPSIPADQIFEDFIVKPNLQKDVDAAGVTKEQCIQYITDLKAHYSN